MIVGLRCMILVNVWWDIGSIKLRNENKMNSFCRKNSEKNNYFSAIFISRRKKNNILEILLLDKLHQWLSALTFQSVIRFFLY
jgi:hypothetical protein